MEILKLVGEVSEYTDRLEPPVFVGKCWKCVKCELATYDEYGNYYFIPFMNN